MNLVKLGAFLLTTTTVTAASAMCTRLQAGTPMYRTAKISPQVFHQAVVNYVNRNALKAEQGGGVHGGASCDDDQFRSLGSGGL